jgi:hypothetical protein
VLSALFRTSRYEADDPVCCAQTVAAERHSRIISLKKDSRDGSIKKASVGFAEMENAAADFLAARETIWCDFRLSQFHFADGKGKFLHLQPDICLTDDV